jgi:transposase-like protein
MARKKSPPARAATPPRDTRAARRERDRDAAKLARDVRRVEEASPGGRPEAAIQLTSASEVEVAATSRPCPLCGESLRVTAHEAVEHATAGRLRVARLTCRACRSEWSRFYRLGSPAAN